MRPTTNKPVFEFDKWIFGKGRPNQRDLLLEAIKNRRILIGSPGVFTGATDTFTENPVHDYGNIFSRMSFRKGGVRLSRRI